MVLLSLGLTARFLVTYGLLFPPRIRAAERQGSCCDRSTLDPHDAVHTTCYPHVLIGRKLWYLWLPKPVFAGSLNLLEGRAPVNSEMNLVFVVPPRGATMGTAQGPHVDIQASSCATFSFFNSWHDVSGWLRTGCIEIWYPGSASSFDSAPGRISASSDGTNKLFPAYETNSHDCLDAPRMYRNLRQPFLPQRR